MSFVQENRAKDIRAGMDYLIECRSIDAKNLPVGRQYQSGRQIDRRNRIRVSQGHSLLREDGTGIDAARLQRGDRILSASGTCTTVAFVSRERYEDTVYNFSFSGRQKYII